MARLKPGVTILSGAGGHRRHRPPHSREDNRDPTFSISVVPLLEQMVGNVRRAVLVLLGSVALVLLIACANVANLLLFARDCPPKRGRHPHRIGRRLARVMRQLLTESLLLGNRGRHRRPRHSRMPVCRLVRAMNPGNIPRLEDHPHRCARFSPSPSPSAVLTGLLFGLAPAGVPSSVDLNTSLKAGGRCGQSDSGLGFARSRLRGLLVVSELALSLMLLIGAGLLVRSFVRLEAVPPGFNHGSRYIHGARLAAQRRSSIARRSSRTRSARNSRAASRACPAS